MKTHKDMTDSKAWQLCQAGHKSHDTIVVPTELGDMRIYDFEQYMGFDGYCSGQDDISKTLQLYGRWEVDETAVAKQILEAGDKHSMFIDAGAHIGWFGRLARKYGYYTMAYEADAENIQLYKENNPKAIMVHHWFEAGNKVPTPWNGNVELLKIDVEGAEEHVIEYFDDILHIVKNILMEVSPVFNDSYPALIEKLERKGFTAFYMDGREFDHKFDFDQTNLIFRRV